MQVDPSAPPGFYSVETVDTPSSELECMGFGSMRRSNSRSGYRLFARVIDARSAVNRMPSRELVCAYFQNFGQVLDCYLPDSATNVAFVCFEEQSSLEACLALGAEHDLWGLCTLHISRASPRPDYSVNTDRNTSLASEKSLTSTSPRTRHQAHRRDSHSSPSKKSVKHVPLSH